MADGIFAKHAFNQAINYNINRYLHIQQKSKEQLAEALNLSSEDFQDYRLSLKTYSAWQIQQIADFFRCSCDMIYPEAHRLKTDALINIVYKLPLVQLDKLFNCAVELTKEASANRITLDCSKLCPEKPS